MNPILIIRADIFSTLIVLFLIIYDRYCARFREGKNRFLAVALACLGHDIMALVTEITVNSSTVPKPVNDIAHILFFAFSVLFSIEYFEYAISLLLTSQIIKKIRIAEYVLYAILIVILIVSPIDYLQGMGTKYSAGIGPTICYMSGFVLFLLADILIVAFHKRISDTIIFSLIPISTMALIFLIGQILIPEFLFTGAALTSMTIGLFCATENPIAKLQKSAYIDPNTDVWNRICYEHDIDHAIRHKVEGGTQVIYVLGDINGLKAVNDTLGHQAGDKLILETAQILTKTMYHSYRVYRIGGDEFAILFLNKDIQLVKEAVELAKNECSKLKYGEGLPVGMSFGIAENLKGESLSETAERADREMYEAKNAYYKNSNIERRKL